MKVSIILPTYNEAENIRDLISLILKSVPQPWEYEIIVVDDNSPDGTYQLVKTAFSDNEHIVPLLRTKNPGLGVSVRAGIEKADGDYVLVMDTDFTHNPVEIPKMLHVCQVTDIVIGSRFCSGGRMQDKRHYIMSMGYNWFIRLILCTQVQDNVGGYFIMNRSLLNRLPFDDIFFGYGDYFFRLLYYALQQRMTVIELPSYYCTRISGESKSNYARMIYSYTKSLLKLRIKEFKSKHGY